MYLAWDTQAERLDPEAAATTTTTSKTASSSGGPRLKGGRSDQAEGEGTENGRGYVALKTVASGVSTSSRGGGGGGGDISKGLFRELRALQALGECAHVVRLLDAFPEVICRFLLLFSCLSGLCVFSRKKNRLGNMV